ncbi:MAG: GNAT family N-acetyltransferase [Clostridiaceae bacterium]|nr:GNAT family N-acetyltransferase [Clostridiaceae bacterium]
MNIEYKENKKVDVNDLVDLYNDAEWFVYTEDKKKLEHSFSKSTYIISAWDDNKLVGVLRAVGDEETIMYIQDILVLKSYRGKGIGSEFLNLFMKRYRDVRQKILLTDRTNKTMNFYRKNGFVEVGKYDCVAFIKN